LLAGNSSESDGNGKKLKTVALGWIARLCAFVFIFGAAMGVSTLLYVAQIKIYTREVFQPGIIGMGSVRSSPRICGLPVWFFRPWPCFFMAV
jgi:hypothetical protein